MKSRHIILFLILLAINIMLLNNTVLTIGRRLEFAGLLIVIQFAVTIWSIYTIQKEATSLYAFCIITLYFFCLFIIPLYAFFYEDALMRLNKMSFLIVDEKMLFHSGCLSLIFSNCFYIGGILGLETKEEKEKKYMEVSKEETDLQMVYIKKIGWFLFFVSVIPFLYKTVTDFAIRQTEGYTALYHQTKLIGINKIFTEIGSFFIPGITCLMIAYSSNKKFRNWFVGMFSIMIVFSLYKGIRYTAIAYVMVLTKYYDLFIKRISGRMLLIIVICTFITLPILSSIAKNRNETDKVFVSYFNDAYTNFKENSFNSLSEIGGSIFPLIAVQEFVPEYYPYRHGSSYGYALLTLIPNLGFWDIHPAKKNAIDNWLEGLLEVTYGTGFSCIAEAYLNFAWYGFAFMIFLGWLFAKVLSNSTYHDAKNSPLLVTVSLIAFPLMLFTIRNTFVSIVRIIVFYQVPVYLFVASQIQRNRQRNKLITTTE